MNLDSWSANWLKERRIMPQLWLRFGTRKVAPHRFQRNKCQIKSSYGCVSYLSDWLSKLQVFLQVFFLSFHIVYLILCFPSVLISMLHIILQMVFLYSKFSFRLCLKFPFKLFFNPNHSCNCFFCDFYS